MGTAIYWVGLHLDTYVVYHVAENLLSGETSDPELWETCYGELNAYGYLLGIARELPLKSFEISRNQNTLLYKTGMIVHRWFIISDGE